MDKMTPAQINRTLQEITLEFFRTKTNYALEGPPFRAIVISKALLISARLTEDLRPKRIGGIIEHSLAYPVS
jgi:hypothetical protein